MMLFHHDIWLPASSEVMPFVFSTKKSFFGVYPGDKADSGAVASRCSSKTIVPESITVVGWTEILKTHWTYLCDDNIVDIHLYIQRSACTASFAQKEFWGFPQ